MAAESVRARKQQLRAAVRSAPPPGSVRVDAEIHTRALALPECESARTIALYAAKADEVSTERLFETLRSRAVRLVLPRMEDDSLTLREVRDLASLRPGAWGILEPPADTVLVPPEGVDLFLVPGLLFDRSGRRLGRGGGHYDRLLQRSRVGASRMGLCYAERVMAELPAAEWDVFMHVIVTENAVIRCEGTER